MKFVALGSVAEVIAGQSPEGKFYNANGDGLPFYQGKKEFAEKFIGNPTVWTRQTTRLSKKGDILMSVRAPVGPVNFATQDVCIGRGLAAIRTSREINPDYLFYQLLHLQPEIAGNEGAVFASINKTQIEALPVVAPSLVEQHRIVALLDEAFSGIAAAKANAEKGLRTAREVFDGYMRDLFLCDTVSQLGELGEFRNGVNYTQRSKGRRVRIVGVKDFKNNFSVPLESLEAVQLDGELNPLDALRANDILFVRSNGNPELIGRCLLMSGADEEISHSGFTIRFRLTDAGVNPKYLCQFLKTPATRRKLTESGTGTNIKSLNQQILSALPVPISTGAEQMRVVMRIEEMSAEVSQLQSLYTRKLAALDELKQSLLQQAFSGQM